MLLSAENHAKKLVRFAYNIIIILELRHPDPLHTPIPRMERNEDTSMLVGLSQSTPLPLPFEPHPSPHFSFETCVLGRTFSIYCFERFSTTPPYPAGLFSEGAEVIKSTI